MEPWSRYQRRQWLPELQGRHHLIGRTVSPQGLELQLDLTDRVNLHSVVGKRWPSDKATKPLQGLSLTCPTAHRRMKAEALRVSTSFLWSLTSLGSAPRKVSTFWPAREPKAIRETHEPLCNGLSVRASSESSSVTAPHQRRQLHQSRLTSYCLKDLSRLTIVMFSS